MKTDYIIVGSGLAALSFGSLMAKSGKRVKMVEAHYLPGGYGHTFELDGYKFNAQLHYVWNCGEGRTVYEMLDKLGLQPDLPFAEYDPNGFDRMRMDGYALDIPYDYDELIARLSKLFPDAADNCANFVREVQTLSAAIDNLPDLSLIPKIPSMIRFYSATLQDVFDHFKLPQAAQTLIGLQWPDFLLPPDQLSFFAWLMLFSGYCRGAYYPGHHFESVIDSLVKVITDNGGEVLYEQKVVEFLFDDSNDKKMVGVRTEGIGKNEALGQTEHYADTVVSNMDPRQSAEMIGFDKFSRKVRGQLNYDYSYSNFMAYCVVKGIDLRDYGFGKSNLFHTAQPDLNKAFNDMYVRGDYSKPSFAVTVPSLLTEDRSDCPPDHQIIEFLTVANYDRFLDLKLSSPRRYREKKQEILDSILDIMEEQYVPDLRKHLVFKVTGSPTTNERYCWSPAGNSYGSNMTPQNMGLNRLTSHTSLENFYFCNASSGFAGFAGTIWTGCRLYEKLSGDSVL
ncbi:MAG: phytoene desaturase family protein [Anaerolineae bacterium]